MRGLQFPFGTSSHNHVFRDQIRFSLSCGRLITFRGYRASVSMKKKDPYESLGFSKTASKDEIKKKYFELAKKYHPDVNKGNKEYEEKFRSFRTE